MNDGDHSIYIACRRTNSYYLALALFHGLQANGCDAFFDADPLDRRDPLRLEQIAARSHFLVVIAPSMLEALRSADDPLRLEIEYAIHQRRNVVPVLAYGFSLMDSLVPGEITMLRHNYHVSIGEDTLPSGLADLHDRPITRRIFGQLTPPDHPDWAQAAIAEALRQPVPGEAELRAEALFNQAVLRGRQDNAGKLLDYDEVLRLNPLHLYAHFNRAIARRRTGDIDGAVEDYDETIRLNPRFPKAYNNRAEIYFAHSYYAEALADYDQAIALRPQYTMALAGKALTLHALGQIDAALALWRPLLEQDQRFADATWIGRELRLPPAMIDEAHHLTLHLPDHASDD